MVTMKAFKLLILVLCTAKMGLSRMQPNSQWLPQSLDGKSLMQQWQTACGSPGSQRVTIPKGATITVAPVTFSGPCKASSITFQVDGQLVAPSSLSQWNGEKSQLIQFHRVDGLTITGSGSFDGKGSSFWKSTGEKPEILRIQNCNNFAMSGVKFVNSPGKHVGLNSVNGATLSKLSIQAPSSSPNTDGIHMETCNNVLITDSMIATGDDCISSGNIMSNVKIAGISCGPGHGISIGSLGQKNSKAAVSQFQVSSCTFKQTQNGVRIKSWPGGSGFVKQVTFQDLTFDNVENGVVIDQFYCNGAQKCPPKPTAVQLNDIKFINIRGTATKKAVDLACSDITSCTSITLSNIQLESSSGKPLVSTCQNAKEISIKPVTPAIAC